MSLSVCVPDLVSKGEISAERGRRILALYDELLRGYRRDMGGAAAEAAATESTLSQLVHDQRLARQRTALAVATQRRMTADMAKYRGKGGPVSPRAAAAVLVRDDDAPYLSFEYLWKAIRGRAHARVDQILVRHRGDLLGRVRDRQGFDLIVDEMHGTRTGDQNAHEVAQAATDALEELRLRANAAGAEIGKLENHGLPHSHHSGRVGEAGFDEWRGVLVPLLDRTRMVDRETGQPMTDEVLGRVLRDVYDAIVTDGWSRREPGQMGRSSLARRLGEHRFLHFRDGQAWRAYNDRFGVGSPYDALMGHIDRMSRDIALMETLGPNPSAGLKWLQDSVRKAGTTNGKGEGAEKGAKKLQQLYDEAIGASRDPYNRHVALVFSHIRSWQTATKLGSATLSATSDVATIQLTKAFNGLPQSGTLRGYLRHLNPASAEDRAHAIRSGLIADEYARRASTQGRLLGEELAGELPRRVAEGVLKVSGLEALTQAGRWTFGKDMISALTLYRSTPWGDLNSGFRRMLDRHGFDAAAWDAIRVTPLTWENGAKWLQPINIANRGLGDRVLGMIQAETDFAVPIGGIELNAAVNHAFRPGTILGELGRTAFQFKSFSATVTMMHAQRMMALTTLQGRAAYFAGLFILSGMAGALALQMKEIAKGKDPRPMDSAEFWGAAMAQGGGLGIYGDFLSGSQNRFGQSFTDTLKGPAWQTVDTLNSLTLDAACDAVRGGKVNYGTRVARAIRGEVPGGSLWYLRAAFERIVLDQMQEQIDPNYRESWKRMEDRAHDSRQQYYWRPGNMAPDRAPNVGNAVGLGS